MTGFFLAENQRVPVIKLEEYKRIDKPARNEVSGIIKSNSFDDTFWVHGDSGTEDRIYAISEEGEVKSHDKEYKGAKVIGAKNKDWEDISRGKAGELILADIGNNCQCRKDLKLFVVKEPEAGAHETEVLSEYKIKYPPANTISSLFFQESPDAEAVFMRNGEIHIITKEKGKAKILRLENPEENITNELKQIGSFNFRGLVTAADISPDESQIAVLTKHWLWLFQPGDSEIITGNQIKAVRLRGGIQIESVTFSGEELIIAEEEGGLYKVPVSAFAEYTGD